MNVILTLTNTTEQLPEEFKDISDKFEADMTWPYSKELLNKLREFGKHYLEMTEEEQKQLETPAESEDEWCMDFVDRLTFVETIELLKQAHILQFHHLVDLLSYNVAQEVKKSCHTELRKKIESNV